MAIVLPVQVKDSAQARRELESVGRASSQAGSQTAKANQEVATTAKQAAQESANLKAQHAELQTQLVRTAGSVAMAAGQISMLAVAVMEAKNYTGSATTSIALLTGRLVPFGLAVTAAAIGVKALADSNEYLNQKAVPAAAAAESAMKSLSIVTERTGSSFADAERVLTRFDDALTSKTSVAQAIRTFNSMGTSMERQIELIDSMRDGIVAMGGDVNTQLPLMVLAIKRQEGELLDNMGVVSTVEQMYKNYAATIGTTADKLNQAQREEAVMQGVLAETAKFAGSAAGSLETYHGKISAVATEHRKLAEDIGEIIMPFKKLGAEWDLLTAKAARYLVARAKALPKDYLTGNIGGMGPLVDPLAQGEQLGPASDEEIRKRIKALQEYSSSLRELRKGGFGPLFPGHMGEEESKHYDNVAAANAKADQEAKREAERKRREREQEAERIAADQKRLAEQLNRDLRVINLEGYARQRADAMQAHQDRLKLAHNNDELMKRSRILYYAEISKIDKKAAEEWTRNRRMMRVDSMAEDFDSKVIDFRERRENRESGRAAMFADSLKAKGELETRGQIEAEIARVDSIAKQTSNIKEQIAAMREIESLTERLLELDKDRADTLKDLGLQAAHVASGFAADAIRGDAPSGGDIARGSGALIGGVIGSIVPGIGTAIGVTAGSIIGNLVGAAMDKQDAAAEEQRRAAEEQRRAAEDQLRAAKQRADDVFGAGSAVADQTRWLNWERMLAEAEGTDRYDEIKAQYDKQRGIEGRFTDFKDSLAGVAKVSGGYDAVTLGQFAESARFYASDGEISADDLETMEKGRYGEVLRDARDNGMWGTLVQALQNLADGIELENRDRVVPGATPQAPSYVSVVNPRELWAYAPRDSFFRSGGPGTRRDNGTGGRAIKVGGRG